MARAAWERPRKLNLWINSLQIINASHLYIIGMVTLHCTKRYADMNISHQPNIEPIWMHDRWCWSFHLFWVGDVVLMCCRRGRSSMRVCTGAPNKLHLRTDSQKIVKTSHVHIPSWFHIPLGYNIPLNGASSLYSNCIDYTWISLHGYIATNVSTSGCFHCDFAKTYRSISMITRSCQHVCSSMNIFHQLYNWILNP